MNRVPELNVVALLLMMAWTVTAVGQGAADRGAPRHGDGEKVTIVQGGRAQVPIVAGSVRLPAEELRRYLRKMTGAELKIGTEDEDTKKTEALFVGLIEDFPWLEVDSADELGEEGFIIQTEGMNVYLVAQRPLGVRHAVTTFLHRLGCRWFFPGEAWEVIPKVENVMGSWNERQTPSFQTQRRIWYGYGAYEKGRKDWEDWTRHNRMGGPLDMSIGHTWFGLDPETEFQAHPEWFAEVDGRRQPSKPCYSHPEVQQRAIQFALDQAAEGEQMISMTPPDGLGYCECGKCRSVFQGGESYEEHHTLFAHRPDGVLVSLASETVFGLVNEVAQAVAAKYPDTLIGCYAYSAYSHPPSFDLHPNVYLQTTTAFRRTPISLEKQITEFGRKTRQVGIREYYSVYQWDWDYPDPGKMTPETLQEDLRFFNRHGVTAINAEASNNWAPRGLGYYLASRLLWDVNADVKSILRDFYSKAFGPAARVMERYYVRWYGPSAAVFEPAESLPEKEIYLRKGKHNVAALKAAYLDLDEAAELVTDRPRVRARVAHLRMYGHYLLLRYRLEQAERSGTRERILEAIRDETVFGGRLTHTHMIHTRPLLGKAFLRRFREFESLLKEVPEAREAGIGWRRIGEPPDPDELEKIWAEDKRALGIP